MPTRKRARRQTHVLEHRDVLDDETLHPGAMVWLVEPALRGEELARFARTVRRRADEAARRA